MRSWTVVADLDYPIVVTYKKVKHIQIEECHGRHDLSHWASEIESVKLHIGDKSIDITKMLTADMENNILDRIEKAEEDGI
jgi:hypothetical protein